MCGGWNGHDHRVAFTVTVTSNAAPTIASAIADQTVGVGGIYSVDLTTVFSDPDNDVYGLQ